MGPTEKAYGDLPPTDFKALATTRRRLSSPPPPSYTPHPADKKLLAAAAPDLSTSDARDVQDGTIQLSIHLDKAPQALPKGKWELKESATEPDAGRYPSMNIVIFVVGSRGDVQPYIALALQLIRRHGHRVRIATHGEFKDFVLDANAHLAHSYDHKGRSLRGKLEFYNAGGDPRELMAYMVKNPGLIPGTASMLNGDIPAKMRMAAEYVRGFYDSTYTADPVNGSFAADAIISNPPAFAHIHVAEALGVPLHMSFTTTAFQHPLVTIRKTNAKPGMTNYLSYGLADNVMWSGLAGVLNDFRSGVLGLEKLSMTEAPTMTSQPDIPWTYCWSESLIPKPDDWRSNIELAGFYFMPDQSAFSPDAELAHFLTSGPPPIYIGQVPVQL